MWFAVILFKSGFYFNETGSDIQDISAFFSLKFRIVASAPRLRYGVPLIDEP